jgi:hypothetical protein
MESQTAKRQKLSDEAQQRMDPFRSALKEHLLQELMFQHLTGTEIKQLFEVSTLWNEIASASVKCGAELKLTIRPDYDSEKLESIWTSGRKYGALKLESNGKDQEFVETFPLLLDIVASIRWNLKELEIKCQMNIDVFAQLLSSLSNLESLVLWRDTIRQAAELPTLQLPKLKQLKCSSPLMQLVRLFRNVTTLNILMVTSVIGELVDVRLLEDFILRQDKLKFLVLQIKFPLFADKNRLNEKKFQLESIGTAAFMIHPNSAVEFFSRQQSLEIFNLYHLPSKFVGTQENHCAVLRSILTLPKLKNLSISGKNLIVNEGFIDLGNIRNTTVKFLRMNPNEGETIVDGKLVEMFSNLQHITVTSFLQLENFRCEQLSLIDCLNLSQLVFRPPLIDFNQINFEIKLEEFLFKNRTINKLSVERNEWIALDIKLSLAFWEKVLQLPNLKVLRIFHPGSVNNLVNLLKKCKRKLEEVFIQTNDIGVESVKNNKLPSWMRVQVIE